MIVRAKMRCVAITYHYWHPNLCTVRFEALYDDSIPEDQRYSEATPSGFIELQVSNPAALAEYQLNKSYYVDFTPLESSPKSE